MLSTDFHKEFASYIVSTSEINAVGLSLKHDFSQDSINSLIKEDKDFHWFSKQKTLATFFLQEESLESYLLEIKAKVNLFYPCMRCLKDIEHVLDIECKMRLLEKEKIVDETSDELSDEIFFSDISLAQNYKNDLIISYFSKQRIDLGLILREQIFLELPDHPICGNFLAVNKNKCHLDFFIDSAKELENFNNPFFKLLNKNS